MARGRGGMGTWAAAALVVLLVADARAVPTVEKGRIRRSAKGVQVAVAGTISETEWGSPSAIRLSAGAASETIDAAALSSRKAGRFAYKGKGVVRRLKIDLAKGRFKAKLAGVGASFYAEPLWLTLDPSTPFDFALPVRAEKARTGIGGRVVHPLDGIVFAPWEAGQDPAQGATTDEKQVKRRLKKTARYTRAVRTEGATHGLELVPGLARARGLEVAAGAALGVSPADDQAEIDGLVAAAGRGEVDLAIVGSDTLARGLLTESELVARVGEVRSALAGTGIPVTTVEPWDVLLAHPAVVAACDVVAAGIFPYEEGVGIDSAMGAFNDHYRDLADASAPKEVVIAETGWPSDGETVGAAVASPENAALYFASVRTWARAESVRVFYAAAFDEAWRAQAGSVHDAHWGIADARGKLKPGMRAAIAGRTVARTWTAGPLGGPGDPVIEITKLPDYGSFDDLEGRVSHVVPSEYGIVTYILVSDHWWVKPRDIEPVTPLSPDGTFVVDVTTGGEDELATRVALFLIPLDYAPPILLGAAALPMELYDVAAAVLEVDRPAP